ncbi:MAG: 16S rRNA (guanine(966)-N(2))-methyltransferase RsmD [Lachnospiraceae bacterium]|nr:16S rRNA (guanine(966)-N(2))-methyltransferase RsmD [Lachnospiraceae bacterium]
MRVISGSAKSLRLKTPRGNDTRPTTDRIKETLFNIIASQIPGSIVLDLFAGSGGLGIEALSRGAGFACFIENNHDACKCIAENLNFTKMSDRAVLLRRDVMSGLHYLHTVSEIKDKCFDLIFIDPPYDGGYEEKIFAFLAEQKYIGENTLIILEAEAGIEPNCFLKNNFIIEKEKVYKTNKHLFIRKLFRKQ